MGRCIRQTRGAEDVPARIRPPDTFASDYSREVDIVAPFSLHPSPLLVRTVLRPLFLTRSRLIASGVVTRSVDIASEVIARSVDIASEVIARSSDFASDFLT